MKKTFILSAILIATLDFAQTQTLNSSENVAQVATKKEILPEGTVVKAALKNEIRGGKMKVGDKVEFLLAEPLIVGNKVIVQKGAQIIGSVTEARASGVLGKKGKLAFSVDYLYLNDGQIVKLTGQSAKNLKGSGAIVAASAVVLTPLGLLIPGKGAKFEAGTVFDAYVAKDTELK